MDPVWLHLPETTDERMLKKMADMRERVELLASVPTHMNH